MGTVQGNEIPQRSVLERNDADQPAGEATATQDGDGVLTIQKPAVCGLSQADFRAGDRGVEPRVAVLETTVLPIHQSPGATHSTVPAPALRGRAQAQRARVQRHGRTGAEVRRPRRRAAGRSEPSSKPPRALRRELEHRSKGRSASA